MDQQSIFTQLSLVIVIATAVSLIMRLFKQPLIMGYILTGIIVGPSVLHLVQSTEAFHTFSEIGIALLLFIIGLGLNASVIKNLGKVVLLTAAAILSAIGTMGFALAIAFNFNSIEALIAGIALFFSSTIIILKVLSDKKEQTRLYGQLAIGVILVDDIVATFALLFVAAAGSSGGLSFYEVGSLISKGVLLVGVLYLATKYVLPKLAKLFASSQEFLFLFTIAWGLGVATASELIGFSLEVGALFAGISLASMPYAVEMGNRLKPLRDFFIVLFFVSLGESFDFSYLGTAIVPAIFMSLLVLLGKPLFIMIALGLQGYTKRTSFKTAIHLSQISEFSMILVVFAAGTGLVSSQLSAVITLVALITIAVSTYLMYYDDKLFKVLEHRLHVFERKVVKSEKQHTVSYPLVLFGYHKGGHEFVRSFREIKKRYVVIDYDPMAIETMERQHIHHLYGDATDFELLEEIGLHDSQLVISTMTDFTVNEQLVKHIRRINPSAVFVCHAGNYEEAVDLYRHGATYVMLPHYIGSEQLSDFISKKGTSKEAFESYRDKHLFSLGRAALR